MYEWRDQVLTGTTILLIVAALIYFGVGQRLLDRMRLTDTQALIFIVLMIGEVL